MNDSHLNLVLKEQLYFLYCQFGPVIGIVAQKGPKRKGQAFVIFQDANSATMALKSTDGMAFFGKEMKVFFAKTKSYKTIELEGGAHPYKRKMAMETSAKHMKQNDGEESHEGIIQESEHADGEMHSGSVDISSKTLFLENIPDDSTEETLSSLFQQ